VDDILEFSDAGTEREALDADEAPFKVLVVDDDDDVHRTTEFAIEGRVMLGRYVSILHARSAAEAMRTLLTHPDTAVALVDVVMERERAGLDLVDSIRNELHMSDLRIIVRTGQPGFAPEIDAVTRYDINDYYTKTELTQTRLLSALTTALRSFEQLRAVSTSRSGLESYARMTPHALGIESTEGFLGALVHQLRTLVPTASDVALVMRRAGASAKTCRVLVGTGRFEEALHRPIVDVLGDEARRAFKEAVDLHVTHESPSRRIIPLGLTGGTTAYLYFETSRRIKEHESQLIEVLSIAAAATLTNVESRQRLDRVAYVDSSTGLPTRVALERQLASEAHPGDSIALVELDRIVDASDALGQRVGDALLREAASRLEENLSSLSMVARVGPATLACLCRAGEISGVAIASAFERPLEVADLELRVPPRVGIATRALADEARVDTLAAGGLALSAAKRAGGHATRVFEVAMAIDTRSRLARVGELRRAVERGELELHFQPQIDLANGRVVGAEALVRWRKSDGELVPPLFFIDLAEQSGLIVPIGEWVLREACRRAREWERMGLGDLRVAVNVSVAQFHQVDFPETVARALADFELAPNRLELELTESIGLSDFDRAREIMENVCRTGVRWALDDFGIGYSSLSYLRTLPVSRLKIDRAFTAGIRSAVEGIAIPKLILELASSLGMGVTAEGVETQAVADILHGLGCTDAQGYHFARPLIADDFVRFAALRNEVSALRTMATPLRATPENRVA